MLKLKTALPFFFAVLLLSLSISIPIVLSKVQDKALLRGIKTETLAADTKKEPRKASPSILKRLQLLQKGDRISMAIGSAQIKEDPGDSILKKQVIKELEKLQKRGGFPDFDLHKALKNVSKAIEYVTYESEEGWFLSVVSMSFSASGVTFDILADAETSTIYLYNVAAPKNIGATVKEQTVSQVFADYLSISASQFKSLYSFYNDEEIQLFLK